MAVRGGSSSRFEFCCFAALVVLLLLHMAAVGGAVARGAPPLGANCGSIDACRAGVANDACCRAINVAIGQGTCACACKQLSVYGHAQLAAACSGKSGCPKCRDCRCSSYSSSDDPHGPSVSAL